MYTYVATGLISAALTATGVWKLQEWRHGSIEKDRIEQALADQRLQAKATLRREETVIAAQNEAQARLRSLRLDSDGSRAALVGLSHATDQALRDAATSYDACLVRTRSISELLNQCGTAHQELGAIADRHASDVQTLIDAWPK